MGPAKEKKKKNDLVKTFKPETWKRYPGNHKQLQSKIINHKHMLKERGSGDQCESLTGSN